MEFFELEMDIHRNVEFYACEGYLIVVVTTCGVKEPREEVAWLYDLVKCTWTPLDIPQLLLHDHNTIGKLIKAKWTSQYNSKEKLSWLNFLH